MTRKHFQMMADSLKVISDKKKKLELAEKAAEIFAKANPRFDRARFMTACGL